MSPTAFSGRIANAPPATCESTEWNGVRMSNSSVWVSTARTASEPGS